MLSSTENFSLRGKIWGEGGFAVAYTIVKCSEHDMPKYVDMMTTRLDILSVKFPWTIKVLLAKEHLNSYDIKGASWKLISTLRSETTKPAIKFPHT